MATDTTTIRVARETRDLLASQAESRGLSLSAMLAQVARREERQALFAAEREAAAADRRNRDASAEEDLWSSSLGDGIE